MFGFLKKLFGFADNVQTGANADNVQTGSNQAGNIPTTDPKPSVSPSDSKEKGDLMQADYVIVGAGPAAVSAAETLQKNDAEGTILILAAEDAPPYSRMAIPYVLTGLISEEGTYLRGHDKGFENQAITVHHANVIAADSNAKTLAFEGGGGCSYDKLLIATGASPVKPPVEGLDLPGVHHCWTLEDARAIADKAGEGSDIVLMGAGFIGCIILEALVSRGANLTVVEAEDRMVPRMMNDAAGNMIRSWCQSKGITVNTSTRVTGVSQSGDRLDVAMDNGTSKSADLVVVATGVQANIGFLDGSGIDTDEGVLVNNMLETSIKGVFAAGDCAQGPDFATGGNAVHAIQPTATEHGHIAALNMTGNTALYQGSLNMNVLDTVGLISTSFGQWRGVEGGENVELIDAGSFRYTYLAFDNDRLVGAVSLGRTNNIGVIRGLIQSRIRLGEWKDKLLTDPNRLVEAYIASRQ